MEAFFEWLVERDPAVRNDMLLLCKLHYIMSALAASYTFPNILFDAAPVSRSETEHVQEMVPGMHCPM